ncbi:prevent-host-death family protein [Roseiarcus fermentans]|uniref:Antitoxin n=1 Tax=Roseiarcus fermentans TaxID=1473586 RepID=A0A366FNP7_9HYPH|nr:type II toxin-antitoxin system Phd/YefM family antitoxin [Roseiarcus fermentans]RBP15756.1 prevent-host-death family protein [Roseiarcus fermentans]
MTTMTSREANQDFSRAKREAKNGPVIITERGEPANVLMTYDDYRRLAGKRQNILDLLAMPGAEDIELDLPERKIERVRDIDLS